MSDNIIEVRNLGKKYIINHQRESYTALRDVITNKIRNLGKKKLETGEKEEFWALRDVSFDIKQGDKVGIIGRNGAGKSTLLKLLSRITVPSAGSIAIKGRVASLLEVGTGFHPELTGRENIFLNGSILGMSKNEINKKFDEIVEFAEIEKFLDTPVKRYSSGMYVRLAFSVAAHLEPEILIVDEVLAVGDAQFQKKCLGKMGDVGKEGRTVLFVSHNMGAIQQLCDKGIVLNRGRITSMTDDVQQLIKNYLKDEETHGLQNIWINENNLYDNEYCKPLKLYLVDENGNLFDKIVSNNDDVWVQIEFEMKDFSISFNIGYALFNEDGHLLYWSLSTDTAEETWLKFDNGLYIIKSKIPKNILNEGIYKVKLIASIHYVKWLVEPNTSLAEIYLNIQGGLSESPYWLHKRPGILAPINKWSLVKREK